MISPPPNAAKLASDLSQCIDNRPPDAARPGRAPLKLLHWALGQLEECARTRTAPPSNVVEVAMAAIKEEIALPGREQGAGPPAAAAAAAAAPGGGGVGDAGKNAGKGRKGGGAGKKPAGAGTSGGGRGKEKGVVFTPLYGCEETSIGVGPVSSILEVGGVTILLDCGWDIHFDPALLEPLREVVKRVDLVLISHSDLEHLGGLPYAFGKLGMRAKVYATLPVWKMGQMAVYDAYLSRAHEGNFHVFDLDDVDAAFARFKTLKFSQHLTFSGRGAGVTITPYAAGRMIGAAVWRVSWQTEDNDIVYATAYNHNRERHLRPSALSALTRPSVLITDAHNALTDGQSRKNREARLISTIMDTVRGGGNVLLPTDTAGRVLELLVLLDEHWQKHRLGTYKLVLLHNTAFNTAEFAKSQLEWMSEEIGRAFDLQRSNPFELRNVHIMHSLEELDELGNDPKVVLATDMSLDFGFSKALLLRWASGGANTILLTGRGHGTTTARELLAKVATRDAAAARKAAAKTAKARARETGRMAGGTGVGVGVGVGVDEEEEEEDGGEEEAPLFVRVKMPVRVPLAGEELKAFRDEENRKRRLELEEEEQRRHAAAMEKEQVIADSDEGSDKEDDHADPAPKRRRAISASLFSKYSKPQHVMFGYYDPQIPTDEYGVKETEPIGWLASAMQKHNSEMPAVAMQETGAALQDAKRGGKKLKLHDDKNKSKNKKGELLGGSGDEAEDDEGGGGDGGGASPPPEGQEEETVDALRAYAGEGKQSAFFQDSGAVPTKLEQEEQELEVVCRVVYVDSEGLSDGKAIKNTARNLAPKMLIVTGGQPRAKAELVSYVRHHLQPVVSKRKKGRRGKSAGARSRGDGDSGSAVVDGGSDGEGDEEEEEEEEEEEACRFLVVNKAMEPLPVALDSGAFDVLLHDSLHTQLKWKQLQNYGIAHMECRVDSRGDTPLLCSKPRGQKGGHPAVFLSLGNPTITQVQKSLKKAGVTTELEAGNLKCCDGSVTVRMGNDGKLELEGTLSDKYFRVRELVYEHYVIV
eukprot:g5803.t1